MSNNLKVKSIVTSYPLETKINDVTVEERVKEFTSLLDTINSVSDKKRALWKEIYENAITDRLNAYMMWVDLVTIVSNDGAKHAIHGQNMTKYLERMSKCNDQLIKLAEMIVASEESREENLTPDEVYNKITD